MRTVLHSPDDFRIVFGMQARQIHRPLGSAALAFLLAVMPSCGSEQKYDWKNREIPWTYGPVKGGATSEHLRGTGTQGSGAIAVGWKCRLSDGVRLTVTSYDLAQSHSLFGKVLMSVGLYDNKGKQLEMVRTEAITAENATFSFEITEAVAKPLYDVVIWFRKS